MHQPGLLIYWALNPERKSSVQLNTKRKTLTIKAQRQVFDTNLDLFLAFFGAPIAIAAPPTRSAAPEASPVPAVNVREFFKKAPK